MVFEESRTDRLSLIRGAVLVKLLPELTAIRDKGVLGLFAFSFRFIGRQGLAPQFVEHVGGGLIAIFGCLGPPEYGFSQIPPDARAALIGVAQKKLSLWNAPQRRLFHQLSRFLILLRQLQ